MMVPRLLLGIGLVAATTIGMPAGGTAAYYDGKQIKVVVGLSPGGTVDTFVRSFMKVMENHLPGKPSIIVQNVEGGGGMRAANHVYESAKPDGLTVYWGPWSPVGQAMGDRALRARYDKFEFIGAVGDTRVAYARADIVPGGIKKPADIVRASGFRAGGAAPASSSDLVMRLGLEVLGLSYKYVTGYSGNTEVFGAMQRGEIQLGLTSIMSFRSRNADFIKKGEGVGLFYMTAVDGQGDYARNPDIGEMPSFPDLYRDIHGKMPSGPTWDAFNWLVTMVGEITIIGLAPPKTDPKALAELRAGYESASKDKAFHDDTVKRFGIPYSFLDERQGRAVLQSLNNVSAEIVATMKHTIASAGQ